MSNMQKLTKMIRGLSVEDALAKYNESGRLKGVVEADETFFRVSFKGQRDLERPAKKRGTMPFMELKTKSVRLPISRTLSCQRASMKHGRCE